MKHHREPEVSQREKPRRLRSHLGLRTLAGAGSRAGGDREREAAAEEESPVWGKARAFPHPEIVGQVAAPAAFNPWMSLAVKASLFSSLALGGFGYAVINRPLCTLPPGEEPLPRARDVVHRPHPWGAGERAFPYAEWLPEPPAKLKAVVILVPGWDGTMADYVVLAEHLRAHGYAVYGSEQRNGSYDPVRQQHGDPRAWQDWISDLQGFTAFVMSRHPGRPFFYHGHSFGTLVTAQTAALAEEPLRPHGIILHSMAMPFIIDEEKAILDLLLGVAGWVRVPHLLLAGPAQLGPTGHDPFNCQWLRSEDRVREGYTVHYFHLAAKLGHEVCRTSPALTMPVLALEGQKDNVVAKGKTQKERYHSFLTEHLCKGHAEVIDYPDGYHTMVIPSTGKADLDTTTQKALRDITEWLDRHTKK